MYSCHVHMRILLYITKVLLQSSVTVIHEYGLYETSPIIKKMKFKSANHTFIIIGKLSFILIFIFTNT